MQPRRNPADAYRAGFPSSQEAEQYMTGLLDRLVGSTGVITADVVHGEVEDTLVHETRKHDVGWVVMSTHGGSGVRGAPMGDMAGALLRRARVPVLAIGPHGMSGAMSRGDSTVSSEVTNVLVALEGSTPAESVLPPAQELARICGARITLLHVVTDARAGPGRAIIPGRSTAPASQGKEMAAYLDGFVEPLVDAGIEADRRLMRAADVAGGIIRAAGEAGADVIAMVTHTHKPETAGLGTASAGVVQRSRLPVLLIQPATQRS